MVFVFTTHSLSSVVLSTYVFLPSLPFLSHHLPTFPTERHLYTFPHHHQATPNNLGMSVTHPVGVRPVARHP